MAKVILEQKLKEQGQIDKCEVDSAAFGFLTSDVASDNAREVIKKIYGQNLLESHKPKRLTRELSEQADVLLVMTRAIKNELPSEKSWTLKEYAGSSGDIWDPFGQHFESYLKCAYEISDLMDNVVEKLMSS